MSEARHQIQFPQMERDLLGFWEESKIFEKSLDESKPSFTFYDGPPFATGLPHYGHLLAGTLKDVVPRYWTMKGYYVKRRWGWDCHGLPIEQLIDEKYKFKSTEEIEDFGIAKYNEECRAIVMKYVNEWKKSVNRIGRWVDFDNSYKTMDRDFMESVWWVFNELWKKGLIYRGYKVMQFSTPLGTPLSNFEAGSNYMDVQDPAITITFPLKEDPNTHFLAWTTTPWTLISNLALAVGTDLDYVKFKAPDSDVSYIMAEALVPSLYKEEVEILERYKGSDLLGKSYEPLFEFYSDREAPNFTVIESSHVTTDAGTGIVHIAPAFGEEDYQACVKLDIQPVCPVDAHGRFEKEITPYAGVYVKDADKTIISDLKEKGRLIKQATIQHSYAFCPRTDTPLISRTVQSWFVKVEAVKEKLVENNKKYTNWVPGHIKEKRFGNWLENARDWAISRNRYWGNPIPVWESIDEPADQRESFCVGSVEELEQLTGKNFEDIHREHLDDLIIEKNGKRFKRVTEVLDCWFESGSMPYAQFHYPFENKDNFDQIFPAQFIAEGLDQTRGWFYTLSILGTILFERPPFENVVVNGLILAEDGKKMSKRLKNYPDPMEVMDIHGADALRLYMINSPVIRGEELKFSEEGVKDIVRRVFLKWWNAYSFFDSYASIDNYKGQIDKTPSSNNILDRWIISRTQSLLISIEKEMEEYHLYNVVPAVLQFIEELTNTYIRLNRSRFWDEGITEDKTQAFDTLYYVLATLSKVMAPFAPFLSEHIFKLLCPEKESVHLESFPQGHSELTDSNLEQGVALMEEVILLGRQLREQEKIKVKIPLKQLIIVHRDKKHLETIQPIESYIYSELNVKSILFREDEESFVNVQCKANGRKLGKKAGKRMKDLMKEVQALSYEQLQTLDQGNTLTLLGDIEITLDDVDIRRQPIESEGKVSASPKIIVSLDTSIDKEQELEGLAREVVSRIQNFRKQSGLKLDDRIQLELQGEGELNQAIEAHSGYICEQTLAKNLTLKNDPQGAEITDVDVEKQNLKIALSKV